MRVLFLAFIVIVFGGLAYFYLSSKNAPLQGIVDLEGGEPVLVSRVRPSVFFRPADGFLLTEAGWKSVRAKDRRLDGESVRVFFACYRNEKRQLITALAEAPDHWEWIAGHHVPYPALHTVDEPYETERRYESIFLLPAQNDPFAAAMQENDTKDTNKTMLLVYRGKFLLFLRKMQTIFEYREPIDPALARTIDLDKDYLRAFAERGRASCTISFPSRKAMDGLKPRVERLTPAGDAYARDKLATWLGEIQPTAAGR